MISIERFIIKTTRKFGILLRKYQPSTSEDARLLHLLKNYNIDVVLDIGANKGQFALKLIDGGYKGQIISFEPMSDIHNYLLNISKKYPEWIIHPRCAVGSENGEITINISGNSVSSSVLPMKESHLSGAPDSGYISSEKTPLLRLDDIIKDYKLEGKNVFIKIDVQGFESEVLKGGQQAISICKGVQIEASLLPLFENQDAFFEDHLAYFKVRGFTIHSINPAFTDNKTGRVLQFDVTFFRE